ncbi:hypothetical protein ASZ78_003993 [Callipepla squamata]|uniref:Maestro-like HEAT-repeats domain-containing protein n=1 Tax=Callipepla squamata TaxID=9009 RepID=A0A226NEZ1_CALSU|nr:hypothetical protein ASZ78_003993 [Callipepla squamata]
MEERSPPCLSENEEKRRTPQDSNPVPSMQLILQLWESCAPWAPLTLWRLQDEEQKLRFLRSICTICDMAVEENMAQELHIFCCRNELVENIMVRGAAVRGAAGKAVLRTAAANHGRHHRPQVLPWARMAPQCLYGSTVSAWPHSISAVEAVLEDKIPLFTTCFQSILLLPSEQDLDISLYTRILMALDQMLHMLVFVHPTASIGEELQSVFQVLLPFTSLQNAAVRQRAVGRIWKLSHSLALFCQAGLHGFMGRISLARYKELRLPVLGQLVGSLVLCCTYQEDRTRRSAVSALRHLYAFILGRAHKAMAAGAVRWEAPQGEDQEKLKQWEDDHKFSLSWTTNVMVIVLVRRARYSRTRDHSRFAKHFYSSEKTNFILTALQGMSDCSNYSTQLAAILMDVLMVDFKPAPTDVSNWQLLTGGLSPYWGGIGVQRIVMAIHRSRKLITKERAQRTIQNTFPWLAASDPHATTLSLLRCSHTCDKDTWELWEMALSSAGVVPWMVQELLRLLEVAPLGQETEIGTLPLAAAMALHKILQHSQYGPQVCLFVLELFVALIFQMVSSASLKLLEVTAVMEDPICLSTPTSAIRYHRRAHHQPHGMTRAVPMLSPDPTHAAPFPCRILVKVVHKLLQCADLDCLVQAMDRHKLWRQLLGAAMWQDGLLSLARYGPKALPRAAPHSPTH